MGKVNYNGIAFDSDLEVEYYKHLIEKHKTGDVIQFIYHPRVPIKITKNNSYTPDFIVIYSNHNIEIIETKGYNPYSKMKDDMTHNIMLQKSSDELSQWLCNNGIVPADRSFVRYRKIKYLQTFGFVDWDFKNPNTLANKRKEKIDLLEQELKEAKLKIKKYERYLNYFLLEGKLTKKQREWMLRFVEEYRNANSNR